LFTVIKHKFKTKKTSDNEEGEYDPTYIKKKGVDKEKKYTDLERFYALRTLAINKSNQYQTVYFGQTDNPNEVAELEKSFREVEMFLFYVMDKSKMFGSVGYNEGM